jgi:hypothetical protein
LEILRRNQDRYFGNIFHIIHVLASTLQFFNLIEFECFLCHVDLGSAIDFKEEFFAIMEFDGPLDGSGPLLIGNHHVFPDKFVEQSAFAGFGDPNNHVLVQVDDLLRRQLFRVLKLILEITLFFF